MLAGVVCIVDAGKTAAVVAAAGSFDSSVAVVVAAVEADTVAVVDIGVVGEVLDGSSAEQEAVDLLLEKVECIVDAQVGSAEAGHDCRNLQFEKRLSVASHFVEQVALGELVAHTRMRVFVEAADHIEAHHEVEHTADVLVVHLNIRHEVLHFVSAGNSVEFLFAPLQ